MTFSSLSMLLPDWPLVLCLKLGRQSATLDIAFLGGSCKHAFLLIARMHWRVRNLCSMACCADTEQLSWGMLTWCTSSPAHVHRQAPSGYWSLEKLRNAESMKHVHVATHVFIILLILITFCIGGCQAPLCVVSQARLGAIISGWCFYRWLLQTDASCRYACIGRWESCAAWLALQTQSSCA